MICVRIAKLDEIKLVNDLCNEVKTYYSLWDDEYPVIENFIESFEGEGLFVIELDGKIIGSLSTEESLISGDYISLTRFFILKDYQKKGYGKILMSSVERKLSSKYEYTELLVNTLHPYAFKMYKDYGYTDLGETDINFGTSNKYHRFVKKIR